MKAYTLFTLKPGLSKEDYKKWSIDSVHSRMLNMPSVIAFRDYEVKGTMGSEIPPYELVEEIEITSPKEFEFDNSTGDGAVLADEWSNWVDYSVVIFCEEIK